MIENLDKMPEHQRLQVLQDTADSVEETTYYRPLTSEDLDGKREQLAENSIKLSELEDEKKAATDSFKGQMKPLANANSKLLREIKSRQEQVKGTLYHLMNHDSGFMESYDKTGVLIATRRLTPKEKQKTIFNISKAS